MRGIILGVLFMGHKSRAFIKENKLGGIIIG